MLIYIVLWLGATLASGYEEPVPKWSPMYSVRIDHYVPGNGFHFSTRVWHDSVNHKIRFDYLDTNAQTYREKNLTDMLRSRIIQIEPITTEEHLNLRFCLNTSAAYNYGDAGILPDLQQDQYFYLGKERMHGEDASHWQSLEQRVDESVMQYDMWIALKDGVYTPVKFEVKHHDTKHGTLLQHEYKDMYDFDPSDIDPKTWRIDIGLDCLDIGTGLAEEVMNPLRPFHDLKELNHIHNEFAQFQMKFDKAYESEEEHKKRLEIFKDNVRYINEHNKAGHAYKLKVNHLADRTEEERAMLLGLRPQLASGEALPFQYTAEEIERLSQDLPENFDWRPYGAVTPVKDQAICGSCWAFGTVGAVEGALFLHTGREQLVRLSEQAVVDCSWGFQCMGCGGGWPDNAYNWMKKHGLPTDDAYGGYIQSNGLCHIADVTKTASVRAAYLVAYNDTKAMQVALFKHGPIAVTMDAGHLSFLFYSHGVYSEDNCQSDKLMMNHLVLAVGYGILDGEQYWLIKNSWGIQWGNGGYMLISTKNNMCGITTYPTYVVLD